MKEKKRSALIALAVIVFIPVLMLLQQYLFPREKAVVPPHMKVRYDDRYLRATENALFYGEKRAAVVAQASILCMRSGDMAGAEKWCRLGAYEYRHPSLMVLYGDLLCRTGRFNEGCRWFSLALYYARKNGKKEFCRLVEKKLSAAAAARGVK